MACAKKPATPASPAVSSGTTRPGSTPATPPRRSNPLIGGWESNCVQEVYEGVSAQFLSYRFYLTIEDDVMIDTMYRFEDNTCSNYDRSIIVGEDLVWSYIELANPSVKRWDIAFLDLNGVLFDTEIKDTVTLETPLSGKQTLSFASSPDYEYTRDQ